MTFVCCWYSDSVGKCFLSAIYPLINIFAGGSVSDGQGRRTVKEMREESKLDFHMWHNRAWGLWAYPQYGSAEDCPEIFPSQNLGELWTQEDKARSASQTTEASFELVTTKANRQVVRRCKGYQEILGQRSERVLWHHPTFKSLRKNKLNLLFPHQENDGRGTKNWMWSCVRKKQVQKKS